MKASDNTRPANSLDLFQGHILDCIPAICEGETLFSWCSQYHQISGAGLDASTSMRLFGSKTAGFVKDFPGRLDYVENVTRGLLGDVITIIRKHTLFALYSAFRTEETMRQIELMMRGGSVERLKFKLGLPSSRASSSHPLKFCSACAQKEIKENGIARWWLKNQWPTVWFCCTHGLLLDYIDPLHPTRATLRWMLPGGAAASQIVSLNAGLLNISDFLSKLASLTVNIAGHNGHFSPDTMRLAFYHRLRAIDWIRPSGTLNWHSIQREFLRRYEGLQQIPGFDFVAGINEDDFGTFGPIFRGEIGRVRTFV